MDIFSDKFIVIDNFLSTEKCEELRNFALYPPGDYHLYYKDYQAINFDDNINEYSIKDLIYGEVIPKLSFLKTLSYSRSWVLVYNNKSLGVPPHTDPSYITVNLWVTPNECVGDPNHNGLRIYDKIVDKEIQDTIPWEEYNEDRDFIMSQIKDCPFTIVPYRYNRAIVFLGKVFHQTSNVDMLPGFDNRRISYTFLFDN